VTIDDAVLLHLAELWNEMTEVRRPCRVRPGDALRKVSGSGLEMRCSGSRLANLVRPTADDAHCTDANAAY
jgi:hypothetical protein